MKPDLFQILDANVNGNSFISIDTMTIPKLKGGQKNPLQGKVKKVMVGANVMVFQNKNSNGYDNMVKRRLIKEGKDAENFNISERKWGTRVPNFPVVEHKGNYYLEVIFLKKGKVTYFVNGIPTLPEDIEGLDYKEEGKQGGLDNKVIIRDYKFENILSLKINQETYTF